MKTRQNEFFTILEDKRLPVIKKLLSSILSLNDLKSSIAFMNSDNRLYLICQNSVIFYFDINECINDDPFYIDCLNTFDVIIIDNPNYNKANPSLNPKGTKIQLKVNTNNLNEEECILFNDQNIIYDFNCKLDYYVFNINKFPIISKDERIIKDTNLFNDFLNIKSDEGVKFFKSLTPGKEFMYPVFTGFPNITKSDDMDVIVHRIDDVYNLIHIIIHKKKISRDINMIYRTLSIK